MPYITASTFKTKKSLQTDRTMTYAERQKEIDRSLRNFIRRAQKHGIVESLGGGWFVVKGHGKTMGVHNTYHATRRMAKRNGGEYQDLFRASWFGWSVQALTNVGGAMQR